jgi:TPR repeat protein
LAAATSRAAKHPAAFAAAGYYARGCGLGEVTACQALGHLFEKGDGVGQSAARARHYYEMSCNSGLASACADLKGLAR